MELRIECHRMGQIAKYQDSIYEYTFYFSWYADKQQVERFAKAIKWCNTDEERRSMESDMDRALCSRLDEIRPLGKPSGVSGDYKSWFIRIVQPYCD